MLLEPLQLIAAYSTGFTPKWFRFRVMGFHLSQISGFLPMGVDFLRKTDYIQSIQ
jgi:hypothetical protein